MIRYGFFVLFLLAGCLLEKEPDRALDRILYEISFSGIPVEDWDLVSVRYSVSGAGPEINGVAEGRTRDEQKNVIRLFLEVPSGTRITVNYRIYYGVTQIGSGTDSFSAADSNVSAGAKTQWDHLAMESIMPGYLRPGLLWDAARSGTAVRYGSWKAYWTPFAEGSGSVMPSAFSDGVVRGDGVLRADLNLSGIPSRAGIRADWESGSGFADFSRENTLCLKYQSERALCFQVRQAGSPDGRAFGVLLPLSDSVTLGIPLRSFQLEGLENGMDSLQPDWTKVSGFEWVFKNEVGSGKNQVALYKLGLGNTCFAEGATLRPVSWNIFRVRDQVIFDTVEQTLLVPQGRRFGVMVPPLPQSLNLCFVRWEGSGAAYLTDPYMEIAFLIVPAADDVRLRPLYRPCALAKLRGTIWTPKFPTQVNPDQTNPGTLYAIQDTLGTVRISDSSTVLQQGFVRFSYSLFGTTVSHQSVARLTMSSAPDRGLDLTNDSSFCLVYRSRFSVKMVLHDERDSLSPELVLPASQEPRWIDARYITFRPASSFAYMSGFNPNKVVAIDFVYSGDLPAFADSLPASLNNNFDLYELGLSGECTPP